MEQWWWYLSQICLLNARNSKIYFHSIHMFTWLMVGCSSAGIFVLDHFRQLGMGWRLWSQVWASGGRSLQWSCTDPTSFIPFVLQGKKQYEEGIFVFLTDNRLRTNPCSTFFCRTKKLQLLSHWHQSQSQSNTCSVKGPCWCLFVLSCWFLVKVGGHFR